VSAGVSAGGAGNTGSAGKTGGPQSAAATLGASDPFATFFAVGSFRSLRPGRERFAGGAAVATVSHVSDANKKVCCQLMPNSLCSHPVCLHLVKSAAQFDRQFD